MSNKMIAKKLKKHWYFILKMKWYDFCHHKWQTYGLCDTDNPVAKKEMFII